MCVENIPWLGENLGIFDYLSPVIRRVSLSWLDTQIDTVEDWQAFIGLVIGIDKLILVNDRPMDDNEIVKDFGNCTLRAYLYRLRSAGVLCQLYATSLKNEAGIIHTLP